MSNKIKITTEGIKSVLRERHFSEDKYFRSIAEYIWNGFDAKASVIELSIKTNQRGRITNLVVKDNGTGINYNSLSKQFEPFYESEKLKIRERNTSELHGDRGIGRLTFFSFSNFAVWKTTYMQDKKKFEYQLSINANKLDSYEIIGKEKETNNATGTEVEFDGFLDDLLIELDFSTLLNYLKREFGWFLELNKVRGYKIAVNGTSIDYSDIISNRESFDLTLSSEKKKFHVEFIQWLENIHEEYSRYYYLDGKSKEKYNEYTTLNKKGDEFYHSLYVQSDYFDDFNFRELNNPFQKSLIRNRNDSVSKELKSKLDVFLRKKRKPFLKKYSGKLIVTLKDEGILASEPASDFKRLENEGLEDVIKCIYEIQPTIFTNLNKEQKKAIVKMIEMLLSSEDRGKLLDLISQITSLEPEEKKELEELLKVTTLSKIIRTTALIKNRYAILEILKKMAFVEEFGANEIDHLQKIVEDSTWLFGEEYTLLGAAEDDFNAALKNFREKIFNEKNAEPLTGEGKRKHVDIYICKRLKQNGKVNNIIIELKAPYVPLGSKEVNQVKEYLRITKQEPRFNADSFIWTYILVGTKFSSDGYIENEIESNSKIGETNLIQSLKNHKIYVKKWSDVIQECEDRLSFVNSTLEIQKDKLIQNLQTPDEAVGLSNTIKEVGK